MKMLFLISCITRMTIQARADLQNENSHDHGEQTAEKEDDLIGVQMSMDMTKTVGQQASELNPRLASISWLS